jgi:tRNA U34 5-methylaminomethyl-2-thiouridine-forming methyltransferase MnmC
LKKSVSIKLHEPDFKHLPFGEFQKDANIIINSEVEQVTKNKLPPVNHQWISTEDGSQTLFSEMFQEACHSTSGARSETWHHYIQGCQVKEKLVMLGKLNILEVGFGLGLGLVTTLEALENLPGKLHYVSLEIDEALMEWFRQNHNTHPVLGKLRWQKIYGLKVLGMDSENLQITILAGDARETLPGFLNSCPLQWDAIYQDAFSPRRNPTLWTRQWFSLLKQYAHPQVILSTYSASNSIRKSLLESGWQLQDGGQFGPKRSSTRATLLGETDRIILDKINRSPVLALTDEGLEDYVQNHNVGKNP